MLLKRGSECVRERERESLNGVFLAIIIYIILLLLITQRAWSLHWSVRGFIHSLIKRERESENVREREAQSYVIRIIYSHNPNSMYSYVSTITKFALSLLLLLLLLPLFFLEEEEEEEDLVGMMSRRRDRDGEAVVGRGRRGLRFLRSW